jgi:predicted DNA-binding transcriptional regulator YafY
MPITVNAARLKTALAALRDAGAAGLTKPGLRLGLSGAGREVSVKTVERCISKLEEDGARIRKGSRDGERIYFLEKGPRWDDHVSGAARLALKLAALTLCHGGTLLWREKLEVIEKVASSPMSNRDRLLFHQLEKAVHGAGTAGDPVENPAAETLEPILEALADRKQILLEYQPAGMRSSKAYELVPYALTHDLFSGGACLLAWELERARPLLLRLNRISSVKVGRRLGVLANAGQLERALQYQIGGWQTDAEPFEVVVRIAGRNEVQALRDSPPALPECRTELEKGGQSMLVRFKANHEDGPLRWALQFGESAEVLAPDFLRQRLRQKLGAALDLYPD